MLSMGLQYVKFLAQLIDTDRNVVIPGAVLECVLSEIHGGRGDRVTAGVGHMTVRNKVEGNRHPMGGFAVEYKGHASKETATAQLESSLERELKERLPDPRRSQLD